MAGEDKLGESTDLLAKAMQKVFRETVQESIQPVKDAVDGLRQDVDDIRENMATKEDIRRLESDMQNGFAELRPPEPEDAMPIQRSAHGT